MLNYKIYGGDSSDKDIYFGGARPKVSMDTGLGMSTTVLSASTPKRVETQQEIRRLTKEYDTLKSEITNSVSNPVPTRSTSAHVSGPSTKCTRKKIETEKPVVRPSKYDGTVSWEDYEIHLELISELNNWKDDQKAMFLAASLSGNAQSVLVDIDKTKRKIL